MRLGDLEMWREQLENAEKEYLTSLSLRQEVEDKRLSRDIAEIYFTLSTLSQYKQKGDYEQEALGYLANSKYILDNNLEKVLDEDSK